MPIASRYADTVPPLVLDIHAFLVRELDLPDPFRSTDPNVGERYGLLSARDYSQGQSNSELLLSCTFLASAAFANYWEAQTWAIRTGLNLDNLIALAKRKVDNRGIFGGFEKSGTIAIGNPRAPLQQPNGQQSHIWVVDVLCPCKITLLIHADPVCGHS